MSDGEDAKAYWAARQDVLYYVIVRMLTMKIGAEAGSIIDVGSGGCPYLDWFAHIPERTSIDPWRPYKAPGITHVKREFLTWEADRHYDLVLCLQVLEHVPDAAGFARKLLATGSTAIISVPYKWDKDKMKSHVHDPVDEAKLLDWFGRPPNFAYIVTELKGPTQRIVQVYDPFPTPWDGLKMRDHIVGRAATDDAATAPAAPAAAQP